jgi:large subunit ribosomal protein L19
MNGVIDQIEASYLKKDIPHIQIGDTVRIHTKIKEGEKERIQVFEGIVIRWKKGGLRSSITVRKISHGVGVERIFPLHTPTIDKIEVKSHGQVRRARLYYLRDLSGKAARIKERGGAQGATPAAQKKDKE